MERIAYFRILDSKTKVFPVRFLIRDDSNRIWLWIKQPDGSFEIMEVKAHEGDR